MRLGDGQPLPPGRGFWLFDLARGFVAPFAAAQQLLHRREFVGRLRLPVIANLLAVGGALALAWTTLRPLFAGLLSGHVRDADTGGLWLALTTLWWLGPVLLELLLAPVLEPLVEVAEQRIAGADMRVLRQDGAAELQRRVRMSARLATAQLLTLPLAWLLALVPVVGIVLVLLLSSAAAALAWLALPLARRQLVLGDRWRLLLANWPFALGFGIACQLLFLVPFLDLLFLAPAATVGAAALYFRFDKARRQG